MGDDRRTAARIDPLRSSLRQLRIDRETRANGYDRIVVANTSVHELRDRADVGDGGPNARAVHLHVDALADLVDAVPGSADVVRGAVRVDEVGGAAVRIHLARAGADDRGRRRRGVRIDSRADVRGARSVGRRLRLPLLAGLVDL